MVAMPRSSIAPSRLPIPLTKGSQPMKPTSCVPLRLPQQVLAGAEADLEPNLADRNREEISQFARRRVLEVKAQARQELADQPLLPRAQGLALPPAIGPERLRCLCLSPGIPHCAKLLCDRRISIAGQASARHNDRRIYRGGKAVLYRWRWALLLGLAVLLCSQTATWSADRPPLLLSGDQKVRHRQELHHDVRPMGRARLSEMGDALQRRSPAIRRD